MIEKFVNKLMKKIEAKNPNMDQKKRDSIWFGLMILFDEVPKTILMVLITYYFGLLKYTLISFISIGLYRAFSGGFHLKTTIACFTLSMLMFVGTPILAGQVQWENNSIKYIILALMWIFNMIMITKYAPADTENVPIINLQQRKKQKIISFITMNIVFIVGLIIKDNTISNTLIFGTFIQSFNISRLAYFIFNNKYGHETYEKQASMA